MKTTHLVIVLLAIIWGSTWLAIKVGLGHVPPFYFAAMRFMIASAVLLPFAFRRGIPSLGMDPLMILLTGILLIPIPYGLVYWGAQYISSGLTAILFATLPIFVAFFSLLLLPDELLTRATVAGLILGIVGIIVIYADAVVVTDLMSTAGVLTTLIGTIVSALGIVLIKRYSSAYDPLALSAFHFLIGALFLLPFAVVTEEWSAVSFNRSSVIALFYLSIFGSGLAFALYYWLLKKMDVTRASLLVYATPLIATYLGWVVLDEVITVQVIIGTVLVLGGIKLAS